MYFVTNMNERICANKISKKQKSSIFLLELESQGNSVALLVGFGSGWPGRGGELTQVLQLCVPAQPRATGGLNDVPCVTQVERRYCW